jgi:hypothetical protein
MVEDLAPPKWVRRWGDWISAQPELPGVWRRRAGGYRIRGRVTDPKTGLLRGVNRALPECRRAREAASVLEQELELIRTGANAKVSTSPVSFAEWSATVFERKVQSGAIVSASGRAKWETILRLHLVPAFGPVLIDKLTHEDIQHWKINELLGEREHAKDVKRERPLEEGRYRARTANTIIAVLRQITAEASRAFNIRDVMVDVDNVSTRGDRTYTYEEPNSVKPADVPRFLAEIRMAYPQHYAFVFLGFTLGLRPSSLRPLRRLGAASDVKWDEEKLLIRRSQTHRDEVMEATKVDRDQVIDLDPEQMSVLRWHVARLERRIEKLEEEKARAATAMRASELLFPAAPTRWSPGGGFRSRSCLDKVFTDVATKLKLGYSVSPRAMRRTFQDLSRAAGVTDIVTRAISGHATETMQRHYSTVAGTEVRAGLAKVIDIATGRSRAA